jgi:hypothetical protein
LLGEIGPIERFDSDAHLARYAGVATLEASSGKHRRHRLDRGRNYEHERNCDSVLPHAGSRGFTRYLGCCTVERELARRNAIAPHEGLSVSLATPELF